jgi:predicted HAD superfamily phosphohydrolase YqeG
MKMHISVKSVLCVGDQLFTDIYGGNLAGIHTILVNPINRHEEIQIVLKRILERAVLHFYKRKLKKEHKSWPGRKFTG